MVTSGTAVGTLPIPVRAGHTFVSWFTAQTGGSQKNANVTVHGHTSYWARWAPVARPGFNVTVTNFLGQPGLIDPKAFYHLPTRSKTPADTGEIKSGYGMYGLV